MAEIEIKFGGVNMKGYEETIEEMAEDFIEEHKEELTEIIRENKDRTEDYIYEVIYQEWDLLDKIHEYLDGGWYGFLRSDFLNDCKTELSSCAKLLELVRNPEDDYGLWEGQEPQKAIETQAFFSVRADLYFTIEKKIKKMINKKR